MHESPANETPEASVPQTSRFQWLTRVGLAVLLLLAFGLGITFGDPNAIWSVVRAHLLQWQAFVDEHLLIAAGLFFLVYVTSTSLSLPIATPLSLTAGALFGRWLGAALAVTASTTGATIAFLSSRYLLRDWVRTRHARWLEMLEAGVERDGAIYLLTLRLMPVFPYFVINLCMGLTPLRTRTFFLFSILGMIPASLVYANIGTEAARVESTRGLLSPQLILALSLLGLFPLLARFLVRQIRSRLRKAKSSEAIS